MRAALSILALTAVLLPACGAPPPAEQKFLDPSNPAEEDGRPMTPSQDPGILWFGCTSATCGNYSWQVNFILPVPAATSGWIVQEVSHDMNITGGKHEQGHFWEGFYVEKGAIRCIYFPLDPYGNPLGPNERATGPDDTYQDFTEHPSNSTGVATITGKAKFYEGTLPADFIRQDGNNPQILSGDRRSTTTQPPFWDGTGTDHKLTVNWDCTAGNDIRTMLPIPPDPDPTFTCPQHGP